MRRVLVTGGTGFIGRHATAALVAQDCAVVATGRRGRPLDLGIDADYIRCDLLHDDLTRTLFQEPFDTLVHLAWDTRHDEFWQAHENLDWCGASLRLAKAFADQGGHRFVGAGTCFEYDPPPSGPCREGETSVAPRHLYSVAKDAFHRVLASLAQQTGMRYAWGRIFFAIGPDEHPKRLAPHVINQLLDGKTPKCTSGTQIRDFMDARDCGRAFAALALSTFQGPVNVCSGQPIALRDVILGLGRELGGADRVALGALKNRPDEPPNLWGDASVLRKSVGFEAEFSLQQSLRQAIDWWRAARRERKDLDRPV